MKLAKGERVEWVSRPTPDGYLRGTVIAVGKTRVQIEVQSPVTGESKLKWVEARYLRKVGE